MGALSQVVSIVQTIYLVFIAWMPVSFQVLFGVLLSISLLILVVRLIGLILDAIPFL